MYCPKCSQQVSEEIRFCSRCGFQLDGVKQLLGAEQNISVVDEAEAQAKLASARKRDILLGATLMLAGSIAVALLMVSTVAGTPLQAVIIPLLLVWAALVGALLLSGHTLREVSKLFSRDAASPLQKSPSDLITRVSATAREALPPAQNTPATAPGSWRSQTAELAEQPSVTEHTTSRLDKNKLG